MAALPGCCGFQMIRPLLLLVLLQAMVNPTAGGWSAEPTASKVLLLAAGRSGSTFVGEMLNQARNSFYLYEPCRSLEGEAGVQRFAGRPNVKRCVELVTRLLDCSFTQSDTDMLFDDFKAMNKSTLVRFVKTGPQGLASEAHRGDRHLQFMNACRRASIRAVKEVRVVEADSESMEEKYVAELLTSGVRILHLIRDPRGVIFSRLKLWQFCRAKGVQKCAPEVCGSYRTTLDALERVMKKLFSYTGSDLGPSRHYLRIKYEDVAIDPVMELGRIYGWAGLGTVEPRINQWVYSTTHASTSDNAFRIQRNATKVALAWKEEMAPRQLQISNRECGDVLVRTGYGTEAEVRAAKDAPLLAMAPNNMRAKKGSGGRGGGGGGWAATKWSS